MKSEISTALSDILSEIIEKELQFYKKLNVKLRNKKTIDNFLTQNRSKLLNKL